MAGTRAPQIQQALAMGGQSPPMGGQSLPMGMPFQPTANMPSMRSPYQHPLDIFNVPQPSPVNPFMSINQNAVLANAIPRMGMPNPIPSYEQLLQQMRPIGPLGQVGQPGQKTFAPPVTQATAASAPRAGGMLPMRLWDRHDLRKYTPTTEAERMEKEFLLYGQGTG